MSGLLDQARRAGTVLLVEMDDVQFQPFHTSKVTSIGTMDLAGCSVVMIASKHGAILAHISPNPGRDSKDLHAGDRAVTDMMGRVAKLYNRHKNYFPSGTGSWVVCAVYQGTVALPDQKRIIEKSVEKMGLTTFGSVLYVIDDGNDYTKSPAKGTAFIDGRGANPIVYVEDRVISQESSSAQQPSYAESSTKTQQPSYAESSTYSQQPSYAESSTYSQQPSYAESSTYSQQPSYAESSTKTQQPSYAESSTYSQQPSYAESSTYSQQPSYANYSINTQQPSTSQPASSMQQTQEPEWIWSEEHKKFYRYLSDGTYEWETPQPAAGHQHKSSHKSSHKHKKGKK